MNFKTLALSTGLLVALAVPSAASTYQALAFNNITVQPAGPRQGPNGLRFFNVEDNSNGAFASFGVAEFIAPAFNIFGTVNSIGRLSLKLTSSNAAFSVSGFVDVWLTTDLATSTAQVGSPLIYDSASQPGGVGTQLDPKVKVGTFFYDVNLGSNVAFVTDIKLDAATEAFIVSQINSGGVIRVIASNAGAGAGTFAGYSNTNVAGPILDLDAIVNGLTTVSGSVVFGDRPQNLPRFVDLVFRDPNDLGTVVHTARVEVDDAGNYATQNLPATAGSYVVSVKTGSWLRDTSSAVDTSVGASGVNLSLINGDIDDDNEVGIGDYAVLSSTYGSVPGDVNWSAAADLNGDESVDIGDYAILSANYGLIGDE